MLLNVQIHCLLPESSETTNPRTHWNWPFVSLEDLSEALLVSKFQQTTCFTHQRRHEHIKDGNCSSLWRFSHIQNESWAFSDVSILFCVLSFFTSWFCCERCAVSYSHTKRLSVLLGPVSEWELPMCSSVSGCLEVSVMSTEQKYQSSRDRCEPGYIKSHQSFCHILPFILTLSCSAAFRLFLFIWASKLSLISDQN